MERDIEPTELKMDPAGLYREESFTDRHVGTIRRLTPVKSDGTPDEGRAVVYIGQSQMLTPLGALPLTFEIEARSLDEAARKFGEAAAQAAERTVEELKELRREAASSIVIPEGGQGGMGGLPGGGLPGGGKIQIP